jgi:glycosyltransferase involved in cell wall biosynthesis
MPNYGGICRKHQELPRSCFHTRVMVTWDEVFDVALNRESISASTLRGNTALSSGRLSLANCCKVRNGHSSRRGSICLACSAGSLERRRMNNTDHTSPAGTKGDPVIVCFPFIGDKLGGSHVSALGLIKGLDRTRFTPLVVLQETEGPVADFFRREKVQFEIAPVRGRLQPDRLRNMGTVLNVLGALPALTSFLKSRKASVVHTNDGRTHVVWGIASKLAGAKLLWHHRGDPSSIGLRLIAPWIANHVASVSKFSAPKPGLFTAARKSSVIFSPFDLDKLSGFNRLQCRSMILKETCENQSVHVLGYVGNLEARKRPLAFIEIIAALKSLAPQQRSIGIILGPASNKLGQAARERARQLGVDDRIHFLGYRHPGDAWIAGLDALLVPSIGEPLGRTLVEAMLLGTLVIATDSGGNREAITDDLTGKIVKPDDPQASAIAYLDLVNRPADRAKIVDRAQIEARDRFGTERHVNAVMAIYDALVR